MEALSLNTSSNDNVFLDRRVDEVDEGHHQSANSASSIGFNQHYSHNQHQYQ